MFYLRFSAVEYICKTWILRTTTRVNKDGTNLSATCKVLWESLSLMLRHHMRLDITGLLEKYLPRGYGIVNVSKPERSSSDLLYSWKDNHVKYGDSMRANYSRNPDPFVLKKKKLALGVRIILTAIRLSFFNISSRAKFPFYEKGKFTINQCQKAHV